MKRLASKTQPSLKDFMSKARKKATTQCSIVPESVAEECFPDAQVNTIQDEQENVESEFSQRLSSRVSRHKWNVQGFTVVDVPMNGDCLFSSLAHQLHLNGVHPNLRSAMQVRQELVKFIRNNADVGEAIENGLPIGESLSQYTKNMAKQGVWGDGNMLAVAARCYGCEINVYREAVKEPMKISLSDNDSETGEKSTKCTTTTTTPKRTLNLAFVGIGKEQDHYVSVITQPELEMETHNPGNGHVNIQQVTELPSCQQNHENCSINNTMDSDDMMSDIFQMVTPPTLLNDYQRQRLILHRFPRETEQMPSKCYADKRKKNGQITRHCQLKWFHDYTWLAYSASRKGLGCLACILFPTHSKHGIANKLISKPFDNWKDATKDLEDHGTLHYHSQSAAKLQAFIETVINKSQPRLEDLLDKEEKDIVSKNRKVIASIVKGLLFCGRYGLSLRGHRDNDLKESLAHKGVFAGLLSLMMESGDSTLREHLNSCAKHCTMTSSVSQNDLMDCIKLVIQSHIVKEINSQSIGPLYSISADEVTDVARWEQLGLVVRYLKDNQPLERLLSFQKCAQISGEALYKTVDGILTSAGLDPKNCRYQNYDGAGNMAGRERGLAARFNSVAGNNAPYSHCANHDLNLVLMKACKIPVILNMMENLRFLGRFFEYPKRSRTLEIQIEAWNTMASESDQISKRKMKTMCQTRWVEKHTSIEDLHVMYLPVLRTLQDICKNAKEWESKAVAEAKGLCDTLMSSDFIAAFETVRYLFGFTKELSKILQKSSLDVVTAEAEIKLVQQTLEGVRQSGDDVFHEVFECMAKKAIIGETDIAVPRLAARQTLRNNVPYTCAEDYYRRSTFLPMIDCILQEMNDRFSGLSKAAMSGFHLIPAFVESLTTEEQQRLIEFHMRDLPSPNTARQEFLKWKVHWLAQEDRQSVLTISATLKHPSVINCTSRFPNVSLILRVTLLAPVSSATVERANSALKFVKSDRRSTMGQERLNALLLLFVHQDIHVDVDEVVDVFAKKHPRWMRLQNPLSDKID